MIPLITNEMLGHGWMDRAGSYGHHSDSGDDARAARHKLRNLRWNPRAGIPGAIVASLGVMTPTLTIGALAAFFYEFFKKSKGMSRAMTGVRPACIGMVAGVTVQLALSNYGAMLQGGIVPFAAISILDAALLIKWKVSVPKVICLSAALGVVLF